MDLSEAKQLDKGDYLMSRHTAPAFMPVRITEIGTTSARFVYVRLHGLSGLTAMAGGWCDATSFIKTPPGCTYNKVMRRWEDDKTGDTFDPKPLWVRELARREEADP